MKITEEIAFMMMMDQCPEYNKELLEEKFDDWVCDNLYDCRKCGTIYTEEHEINEWSLCGSCRKNPPTSENKKSLGLPPDTSPIPNKGEQMTIKEYQEATKNTAVYYRYLSGLKVYETAEGNDNCEIEMDWLYPVMGLAGECGELLNKMKKVIRDDTAVNQEFRKELSKEIGDIMWYVSQTCNELGLDLEEILENNIKKLQSRKDRGKLKGSGDNR